MAKAKVNQSQAVRDYLAKHPGASPKEVREALATSGINVSAALVSNVKSRQGSKPAKSGKRAAGKGRATAAPAAPSNGEALNSTASQLASAVNFVKSVGGIENARTVIEELAQVQLG